MMIKRIALPLALLSALSLTAPPSGASPLGEVGGLLLTTEVCGQASSCAPRTDYVCSTHHGDYEDKVCYTGCDEI